MPNKCHSLHGTVISFEELDKNIPQRSKFLEPNLHKKINNKKINNKDLLFMPSSTYDEKSMQQGEYTKSKYKLILFGIFEDGMNGTICINDIEPYFEIKIPDAEKNKEEFAETVFDQLQMEGEDDFNRYISALNIDQKIPEFGFKIEPIKFEIVFGKPLHNFQEHDSTYVRVYFNKLAHRKSAINYIRSLKYETAHDDLNSYYRVVSRDYFLELGKWINIKEYRIDHNNQYIKGDVFQVSIDTTTNYTGELTKHLLKDSTMTMAFDIETYNKNQDGEIPMPEIPEHNMFMISMVFQIYHSSDKLLQVCLVDVPSAPHPDFLTIVCKTEENLILAFAKIFNKMHPEFIMGFNSDQYDWLWIITRAQSYKNLLTQVVELFDQTIQPNRTDKKSLYSCKKLSIKIEATLNVDGYNLQTPGFIPIDLMTIFRKLYPTSEQYSLNFFLSKNKLGGKEDMPYLEMFRIYEQTKKLVDSGKPVTEELLDKMSLVANYCVIDSYRCHELLSIRNVLQDKREVANISYTSIYDAFYRADGMKVRNLTIAKGNLRNLKISNIANEVVTDGKYPGAWVCPPTKGLSVSKLNIRERIQKAKDGFKEYSDWLMVTEEQITDFKNLIEISGPMAQLTEQDIKQNKLPNCFVKMMAEPTGRPITGLDYSSLYPSLMMTYNLSPEYMITNITKAKEINSITLEDGTKKHNLYKIKFNFNDVPVRGWSVRHDNNLDPTKPEFKFGIFPTILKDLFDARKQLKSGPKGLMYFEHKKEELMALSQAEFEMPENKELFEDTCFSYNALDSKQRALKVFMNTFYGESGNKRSPLFMIQVAGGITTAGQDNIKRAFNFVKEQDCKVYYGDSVVEDTPILIKYTTGPLANTIDIRTIDDIPGLINGYKKWHLYPQFKSSETEPIRIDKQQHAPVLGLETWTHNGWAPIKKIIRHRTDKKIIRINTHSACIDITEDHSLLSDVMETVNPKDANVGDSLMHTFPVEFLYKVYSMPINKHCNECNKDKPDYEFYKGVNRCKDCEWFIKVENGFEAQIETYFPEKKYIETATKDITIELAFIFGIFHSSGSCSKLYTTNGVERSWTITRPDINVLNILIECLKTLEPNLKFKTEFVKETNMYNLVPVGDIACLVEKYRKLFCNKKNYKIVPICILNSPIKIRKSYWYGFYLGDVNKIIVCQRSKISIQRIYYLMKSIGFGNIVVNTQEDNPDIYCLTVMTDAPSNKIKKIIPMENILPDSYVYDIETEAGTFLAGVGNLNILNTDSLYIATPEADFKKTDIDYYTEKISKLAYWEQLVEITFKAIKPINTAVNEMLFKDNGTHFLKMAFEESLFPVAFLAKKKYFGVPHLSKPNFNENVPLFIRGLELKKRGVSQVLKDVCSDILTKAVNHKNIKTIIEIVENKIEEFYNTDWSTPDKFEAFVMTGIYKPNKQNVKMHTFKKRMQEEHGIDLIPGERNKYVIVRKYPYKYDLRGRKIALSVGDTMELADKAMAENIPINIDYYMDKTINGQLARFITYHDDFQVNVIDSDNKEEIKKAEDQNLKLARKYIDSFCQKYYTNYSSRGTAHKTIFKKSALVVKNKIMEACGNSESSNTIIKLLGFSVDPDDNLEEWLIKKIHSSVDKNTKNKNYGFNYINNLIFRNKLVKKEKDKYILELQGTYYANKQSILKTAENQYQERQQILDIRFRQSINVIKNTYHTNNNIIEKLSKHIKSIINLDSDQDISLESYIESNNINETDLDTSLNEIATNSIKNNSENLITGINELKFIYHNLISNYEYIYQIRSIVECLKLYRDKKINIIKELTKKDKDTMLQSFIQDSIKDIIKL